MKNVYFISLILFIAISANAQSDLVSVTERKIGWSNLKNKDISGKEITFIHSIFNTGLDSSGNLMVVRLHKLTKKGRLVDNSERFVVYDLANDTVKWFADDNFLISRVVKYGTYYLHIEKNKCSRLNGETGKRLWTAPFFVYHVDPVREIALGYKIDKSRSTTILQGLNLVDGKVLWERNLSKRYGWNEVVSLDTSSVLVVSEGLHLVRLNDGSGWDYSAVTGELNTAEEVASFSALAALTVAAALNGSFVSMPAPHSQVVYDVVSNVCQDSAGYYFAAKNQISCMDLNGQLKWCTELPDNVTSKSFLIKTAIHCI
ncbi:MAG: PQQ-binding-like beta-propeller repeat protein [Bacteroidetes bacterium]|nr:PQQ-binding-like beta-propeller repeat protein [Bacteroidota bacterium]